MEVELVNTRPFTGDLQQCNISEKSKFEKSKNKRKGQIYSKSTNRANDLTWPAVLFLRLSGGVVDPGVT